MNILANITETDITIWLSVCILCGVLFSFGAIVLIIKRDTTLISKKSRFAEPTTFALVYGITELIISVIIIIISIIGLFFKEKYLIYFGIDLAFLVVLLLTLFVLQKKYEIKR